MRLENARVAQSATVAERRTLPVYSGRVVLDPGLDPVLDPGSDCGARAGPRLDLSGHLLLPGLINAHDHLEFNLFPRLGRRMYANATEWAMDIHRVDESPVREHLRVPKAVRLFWGGMKNLLSGVTTVAHHNEYDERVFDDRFPVRVLRNFGWAHSLEFSRDIRERYLRTRADQPFIIHAGEGTDECAGQEIYRLENEGVLGDRTVLVHAFGFDAAGIRLIGRRKASLVWCPSSNLLTCGRTLAVDRLIADTPVALGTDSAISAAGDMVDEIYLARQQKQVDAESLYRMVTDIPARILRLNCGRGAICAGGAADLVAVRDAGQSPAEAITDLNPELVMVRGRIQLISTRLAERCDSGLTAGFHPIQLEGRGSWLTPQCVTRFLGAAESVLGPGVRLAGKLLSQ